MFNLKTKAFIIILFIMAITLIVTACQKSNIEAGRTISIDFTNMPQLETGFFTLWLKNGPKDERLRQFLVSPSGQMTDIRRRRDLDNKLILPYPLFNSERIFLTIEAISTFNTDYKASKSLLLSSGPLISGEDLNLTFTDLNLKNISGKYVLHNYSDNKAFTATSGLWFYDLKENTPQTGLFLPTATYGWIYQAWIKKNNRYLSLGQFGNGLEKDLNQTFSAGRPVVDFPGEDFMYNAPPNFDFPLVINDGQTEVIVSLEPYLEPVGFKEKKPSIPILQAKIPKDLPPDTVQTMMVIANPLPITKIIVK